MNFRWHCLFFCLVFGAFMSAEAAQYRLKQYYFVKNTNPRESFFNNLLASKQKFLRAVHNNVAVLNDSLPVRLIRQAMHGVCCGAVRGYQGALHLPRLFIEGLKDISRMCVKQIHMHPKTSAVTAVGVSGLAILALGRVVVHELQRRECPLCLNRLPLRRFYQLSCGHQFCVNCLRDFLNTVIRLRSTDPLRCSNPGCRRPISEHDVRAIASGEQLNSYNDVATQEWINRQPGVRHCPTLNCRFSFINEENRVEQIQCPQCRVWYCASCLVEHHPSVRCREAQAPRRESAQSLQASREWVRQHTKQCPSCHRNIEKNEGCIHMTCSGCRHEFCWECLRPWAGRTCAPGRCSARPH